MGDLCTEIECAQNLAGMPFFLDADLNHSDICNNWSPPKKCTQCCSNRVMGETYEVSHTKIPDSDRTSLPYPVFQVFVANYRTGKRSRFFRNLVRFPGFCTRINIRICSDIPLA